MSYDEIYLGPRPLPDPLPRHEGRILLFIPLLLLSFAAGLWVAIRIDAENDKLVDPDRTVDISGHEGEVLVVLEGGTVRWCERDDERCY